MTDPLKGLKEKMAFQMDEMHEELHGLVNEGSIEHWSGPLKIEHFTRWENARLQAIVLKEVGALVEAASKVGLQCANTGVYGHLGLGPGDCACARCEFRQALAQFRGEKND